MTDDGSDTDEPLADIVEDLENRGLDTEDLFDGTGFEGASNDAFTEMDIEEVDAASVWADLESGGEEPVVVAERISDPGERDVRIIPKRTCHSCPYFGEPPEVSCNHDGTEIRQAVGVEEFEVVDCPMVLGEDELE